MWSWKFTICSLSEVFVLTIVVWMNLIGIVLYCILTRYKDVCVSGRELIKRLLGGSRTDLDMIAISLLCKLSSSYPSLHPQITQGGHIKLTIQNSCL